MGNLLKKGLLAMAGDALESPSGSLAICTAGRGAFGRAFAESALELIPSCDGSVVEAGALRIFWKPN